jgi:hypothetical protein
VNTKNKEYEKININEDVVIKNENALLILNYDARFTVFRQSVNKDFVKLLKSTYLEPTDNTNYLNYL